MIGGALTETGHTGRSSGKKLLRLSDLEAGAQCRIIRVKLLDQGCRRRFAELGIYEGTTLSVAAAGDTMILALGNVRMGISAHCAHEVQVMRI
ncbi:MAG: FeoA family protein [Phycisphaerae bacterium]